jgi:hypothetical protein
MKDAAACRHPLHVAGPEAASVAQAVAVLDAPSKHIRNRLDSPMRVPRETGRIIVRVVVPEIVEEQEGIERARSAEAKRAPQVDTSAF